MSLGRSWGLILATGLGSLPVWSQVPAPAPLSFAEIPLAFDSGWVANSGDERAVTFSHRVTMPGAHWLRLTFESVKLGRCPAGGRDTIMRIRAMADGAVLLMNSTAVRQWRNTTAYLNGDSVQIEIVADPCALPSRLTLSSVLVGTEGGPQTICGETDDRVPSTDPRVARVLPICCTTWIIDDARHCFLTAGHCEGALEVVEFNVPLSDAQGRVRHPPPEDQYAVDPASLQASSAENAGNDWAYFGCFPNPNTGLTPVEAQGDFYVVQRRLPTLRNQNLRVTGFGSTAFPAPPEWNKAQKTHTGSLASVSGNLVAYEVDTSAGNSGSPVIDEGSGEAIAIHTHGGCTASGGQNQGTATLHPALRNALDHPQGVCVPLPRLSFQFRDGLPEVWAPDGGVISVVLSGQNGGEPAAGTGLFHFDLGDGFRVAPMREVSPNVYEADTPPAACLTAIRYFFSAETTDFAKETAPGHAPQNAFVARTATRHTVVFHDDFEIDRGWNVMGDATAGHWERGTPVGGERGDPPFDADGSGRCFLTENVAGNSDVDGGRTRLVSPRLNLSGEAFISYYRWFSNSTGSFPFADIFRAEISNDDGTSWVVMETVGPEGSEVSGGWIFRSFRVANFVEPTAAMRIRFEASDDRGASVVEAGIDDVRVESFVCSGESVFIRGDADGNGALALADGVAQLEFLFGAGTAACELAFDVTDDDLLSIADPLYLLQAIFLGGPPIPAPFPDCGPDPNPGTVTCQVPPPCDR